MPIYFQIWILCFGTLAVAVVLLSLAYQLLGSDLGTEGFVRETFVALCASALQALLLWAVVAVTGAPHFYQYLLAAVVSGFVYLVTHIEDMDRLEASLIGATQFAMFMAAVYWFGWG